MTLYWPVLQARLVALAPTIASGFTLFDGLPAGVQEKGANKTISVGATKDEGPGAFELVDDSNDALRAETGNVLLEVISWAGDTAVTTRRSEVFAVVSALDAAIRADRYLGVLPPPSTVSVSVTPVNLTNAVRLVISLNYTTRS